MTDQERAMREREPDAGDADLDALLPVDVEPGASRDGGPIDGGPIDGSAPEERQDRDHVGVDWDLTQPDRG